MMKGPILKFPYGQSILNESRLSTSLDVSATYPTPTRLDG